MPIFENILTAFQTGAPALKLAIAVAWVGIAVMAFMNLRLLIWNLRALTHFAKTETYTTLRNSNGETQLLAAPLAMAMTINVLFIVGLVFVPGLWRIVEYLFPAALVAFLGVGMWAFLLIGRFLGRVLSSGGAFALSEHNSFAQLLPAFALSMVGVGLAAPAALSTAPVTMGLSLVLSTFFGTAAVLYTLVAAITGFNAMLRHGTAREAGPTLMVIVPIVTVLGILFMRQSHGLHSSFNSHATAGETLVFLARLLTIEILFLMLGMLVLRRQGYFRTYLFGAQNSAGSYALVCPGVAFAVMMHFFINKGLVAAGIIDKFDPVYWLLSAVALFFQALMIWLVLHLNRRHFRGHNTTDAIPAA